MIKYIFIISSIYAVLLVLFLMCSTSLHEYIHFWCAYRFSSCKALIFSQFNIYKNNPNIKWVKKPLFKGGETFLDNDFLAYTSKQIRVIAIMPSLVSAIIWLIITLIFCYALFLFFNQHTGYEYLIKYYIIIGAIISLWFLLRGRTPWCDRAIFLNPDGFKAYMRNQHEHSLADSYQRNIIKRGTKNAVQKHV